MKRWNVRVNREGHVESIELGMQYYVAHEDAIAKNGSTACVSAPDELGAYQKVARLLELRRGT